MVFFTGKNEYTRPVDFVPVTDPTRKTSTRTRPIPAGTGRVRVYPRVRVDPHTSSSHLCSSSVHSLALSDQTMDMSSH